MFGEFVGKEFLSPKVSILQRKLNKLPLIPLNKRLRNQRDKIERQLIEESKKSGDISKINLQGGYY